MPSHNTSVETVVNNIQKQPEEELSFMGVLDKAINTFSTKIERNEVFDMSNKASKNHFRNSQEEFVHSNVELQQENMTLYEENDELKEELSHKDHIIDQLNAQIHHLSVTLKECEIRLGHTTDMYAHEKQEKENTIIACNRILSRFTTDDINSTKFLSQNREITQVSPPIRMKRGSGGDTYPSSLAMCQMDEEEEYSDKTMLNHKRRSSSRMNTSTVHSYKRSMPTNCSNLVTGGDTTFTGILNNESYDFNPKDMEEMDSIKE